MGSWDVSAFGNDEARQWLSELILSTSTEAIFRALVAAAKIRDDQFLQAPDCERALAAAELVAAARGKGSAEIPQELTNWLKERQFVAGTQIADLSIRVLERVCSHSELKDVWDDTDSADDWYATVRNLQQRLKETREAKMEHDLKKPVSADDLCEEAALLVAGQNYQQALAKYEEALTIESKSQTVFMGRAICHLWMQNHDKVIEDINRALSVGDPIADAYHLRSQAFFHLQKYRNVVADLSSYLRSRPQHIESYFIRGLAYEHLQQFQNAIADYSQVIDNKHEDHLRDALHHRAQCYHELGQFDLASWDMQQAAQLDSTLTPP